MRDLTLKRVDAAVLKSLHIKAGNLSPAELGATTIRCQFSDIRAVYFAAMHAAAKLKHRVRAEETPAITNTAKAGTLATMHTSRPSARPWCG